MVRRVPESFIIKWRWAVIKRVTYVRWQVLPLPLLLPLFQTPINQAGPLHLMIKAVTTITMMIIIIIIIIITKASATITITAIQSVMERRVQTLSRFGWNGLRKFSVSFI